MPSSLGDRYETSERTSCLQPNSDESSRCLWNVCTCLQILGYHIPEDRNHHNNCCENLRDRHEERLATSQLLCQQAKLSPDLQYHVTKVHTLYMPYPKLIKFPQIFTPVTSTNVHSLVTEYKHLALLIQLSQYSDYNTNWGQCTHRYSSLTDVSKLSLKPTHHPIQWPPEDNTVRE